MFQSRKQDYFNWKSEGVQIRPILGCFSPASRIILIESLDNSSGNSYPGDGFSPASRIILIERLIRILQNES